MHVAGRLTALVVTVAVLGCMPASERDLVGTWQITDGSREREHLPQAYRKAAGTLTLAADGTFSALELPVSVPQSPSNPWPAEPKPALLTGSGTWKLGRSGAQMVQLSIEAGSKDYPGILPYGYNLSVRRFRDYRLVDYWGDPDVVPGIFYSRADASAEDVRWDGSRPDPAR